MRFIEERLPPLTEVALAASALAELHGDVALWRSRDNRVRVDYVSTFRGEGVEPDLVALPVGLRFDVSRG
jgi:hypothetical protein